MKNLTSFLSTSALIIIVLCSTQCKKTVDELSKLPPITQEGKRTFGCLVNGKAWIPERGEIIIATPAIRFNYDNEHFSIIADKENVSNKIDESLIFGLDSCNSTKSYSLPSNLSLFRGAFNNYELTGECRSVFSADSGTQTTGVIKVVKFDLTQGIIAGTFEFTLSKNGCETIKITNGRFDAKL